MLKLLEIWMADCWNNVVVLLSAGVSWVFGVFWLFCMEDGRIRYDYL